MLLRDAVDILRENGAAELGRRAMVKLYRDFVRPHLPKRERRVTFDSVETKTTDVCVFDSIVPWFESPWYTKDNPDYEEPLLNAVHKNVGRGDSVVIVGGGWGISTTIAARCVGSSGDVTVYEGAENRITNIRDTVRINDVADRVTIRHAIVAKAVHLTGPPGRAQVVSPSEIGECDVIELDCEGAETDIIPNLSSHPETFIVETHRNERIVRDQLAASGYEVTNRAIEKQGEIYVLTAVMEPNSK